MNANYRHNSSRGWPPCKIRKAIYLNEVAFVFVSSPNSVTPVHFDIEHSLLRCGSEGDDTVSIGCYESDAVRRRRDQQVLGWLPAADRGSCPGGEPRTP